MFSSAPLHPSTSQSISSFIFVSWVCKMLKRFTHVQVLLEVAITPILVEEENTSACRMCQSTTSTRTGFSQTHTFMALNMKSAHIVLLRRKFTITTFHVLCVTSSHVLPSWWYQQGMTVPLVGPRSTMGIWWQIITTTSIQPISFALTGRPNLFTAAIPTKMVP